MAAMQSFGVTAKLNRARQFALRTGVTATPTIIVNGKYRVNITTDRSWKGMLQTVNFLVAKERAERPPRSRQPRAAAAANHAARTDAAPTP